MKYIECLGYATVCFNIHINFIGAAHMLDVPYMFGLPFLKDNPSVMAESQINDIVEWDETDRKVSVYVMDMWTNFAKYG